MAKSPKQDEQQQSTKIPRRSPITKKYTDCLDFKDSPGNRVERLSKSQPPSSSEHPSTASLPNDHSQDEDDPKIMIVRRGKRLANSDGANGNRDANEDGKNNDAGIIQDEDTNGNNSKYHITSFSSSPSSMTNVTTRRLLELPPTSNFSCLVSSNKKPSI
eukprot:CCRYP_013517-RF/>CCRYP_013517-RF protein AED:0.44 eAED:0.44 QI:0/0/0/1/0/0/3/0/159